MNWNAALFMAALAFAAAAVYVMMVDRTYAHCLTENRNPGPCWAVRPPW